MEPAPKSVRYRIPTTVNKVYQKAECTGGYKNERGENVLTYGPARWFVHFTGSTESLCFGEERPALEKGDAVDIVIERRK